MKVKVCGITSYEDAVMALDHGADALGFNFFPGSPRYLEPEAARTIIDRLPPFTTCVGVFVNVDDPEVVSRTAREARIQVLQLHGDESPAYCRRLAPWPLIKVLRIGRDPIEVESLTEYPVRAFLLDSKDDRRFGGTGKTFDWAAAAPVGKVRPVILAGGLTAINVAEAIRTVRPFAVDVSSGVESAPGKKDVKKLNAFMREVENVTKELQDGGFQRARS